MQEQPESCMYILASFTAAMMVASISGRAYTLHSAYTLACQYVSSREHLKHGSKHDPQMSPLFIPAIAEQGTRAADPVTEFAGDSIGTLPACLPDHLCLPKNEARHSAP